MTKLIRLIIVSKFATFITLKYDINTQLIIDYILQYEYIKFK